MPNFICTNLHKGQNSTICIQPELDEYAFMHSSAFKKIFEIKQKDSGLYSGGGYLKLSRGKNKIYIKYHQLSTVEGNKVALSYRNRSFLGIKDNTQNSIKIQKTCWFLYNWNNRNVDKRWNFRGAFLGFLALIIIQIPEFILTLIQFCK